MYICLECQAEFETPALLTETHGLPSPPYETFCVCPRCKTTNFKKREAEYCRYCGARLKPNQKEFCGDLCKLRREKLLKKEYRRNKKLHDSNIYKVVRELQKYNSQNNTRLSYGQYTFLMKSAKQRKDKNVPK